MPPPSERQPLNPRTAMIAPDEGAASRTVSASRRGRGKARNCGARCVAEERRGAHAVLVRASGPRVKISAVSAP